MIYVETLFKVFMIIHDIRIVTNVVDMGELMSELMTQLDYRIMQGLDWFYIFLIHNNLWKDQNSATPKLLLGILIFQLLIKKQKTQKEPLTTRPLLFCPGDFDREPVSGRRC